MWVPLGEPSVGGRVTGIAYSPHDADRVLLSGDMLGVGLSRDGGRSWEPTFGLSSWEVGSITWHPHNPLEAWIGTMGGPYHSVDGGRSWTLRRTGMPPLSGGDQSAPIEIVLFDPNDHERLIAAGGSSRRWRIGQTGGAVGAVWESTDGGALWTRLATLTPSGSLPGDAGAGEWIVGMAFAAGSSSQLYATVHRQGVYASNDGGQSWQRRNSGLPHLAVERILPHPADPQRAFVSLGNDGTTPGGIYRSDNAGLTWNPTDTGLPKRVGNTPGTTSRYRGVALAALPTGALRLLAVDDRFGSDGAYLSDDGGASWSRVLARGALPLPYPSNIEMEVATIAPGDPDRMMAAGSANLIATEDGGATWRDAANARRPMGARNAWAGLGYSGLVATEIAVNPWRPGHWLAQGFDGARVLQTLDGGATWTFEASDANKFNGGADAVFASADVAYASMGFQNAFQGVARTLDGGVTWQVIAGPGTGLPAIGSPAKAGAIHASRLDPARVWVLVDGDLLASSDSGSTWTTLRTGVTNGAVRAGWFAALPDDSAMFVSGQNEVFTSTDGVTFASIGGPGRPGKLAMGPDGVLWLAAHDGSGRPGMGLWTYTAANGWNPVLDPSTLTGAARRAAEYVVTVAVHPADPRVVAISTSDPPFRDQTRATGVHLSLDGGQTWRAHNDGLPMIRGAALAFDPHHPARLLLGTTGRGFFQLRF